MARVARVGNLRIAFLHLHSIGTAPFDGLNWRRCADAGLTRYVSELSGVQVQKGMMLGFRRLRLLLAVPLLAGLSALPARADDDDHSPMAAFCEDDDDHDLALLALRDDLVRPLSDILAIVTGQFGGTIIRVDFECDDGLFLYELRLRTNGGEVAEVTVNAATGAIIEYDD